MADTDPVEWRLLDSDLITVLGILPALESALYVQLSEPGSGSVKIPLDNEIAASIAPGQFVQASYRGKNRGGFFIEHVTRDEAGSGENGSRVMTISGRGAMALLDDAIVWGTGGNATTRRFGNMTRAAVLIDMIDEAKARGALGELTYDFSDDLDSDGVAWTDNEEIKLTVGSSLLDVARKFAGLGMELNADGDFVLHAYNNGGAGADKTEAVYFRIGKNCRAVSDAEQGADLRNSLLARYEDGYTLVEDATSIAARRRREKLLDVQYAGNSGAARTFAQSELELNKEPQKSITLEVDDRIGPYTFVDYGLGDRVTLDRLGEETEYRVRGMSLRWDTDGYATVKVDLNSTGLEHEIRMAQSIQELRELWETAHDAGLVDVTLWAAISEPAVGSSVRAFAMSGSTLYVGGSFTKIGGVEASNVAAYDIVNNTWSALGSGVDGLVQGMVAIGENLYVCGTFGIAGGSPALRIAKWDGSAWSALPTLESGGVIYSVYSLEVDGTDLLAAVQKESSLGGVYRWNGGAWSQVGTDLNAAVYTVKVDDGGDIYIGGAFLTSGMVTLNHVAKLNGSTWEALGDGVNGFVRAIAFAGSVIYIGGDFAGYIAAWNGAAWSVVGGGTNGRVDALATSLTDVYVGGRFTVAGGVTANYIVKWNGGTWETLAEGLNDYCWSVIVYEYMNVYAGGQFTEAGGKQAHYAAAYLTSFDSIHNYLDSGCCYVHPNHTGEVTSIGDGAQTISNGVVTNAKLAVMPSMTVKGNDSSSAASPQDLTDVELIQLLIGSSKRLYLIADSAPAGAGYWVLMYSDTDPGDVQLLRYRGSQASPSAILTDDILGRILGRGYDGGDIATGGRLQCVATEDWNESHHGARWEIQLTPTGSTTPITVATINGDGVINVISGGGFQVDGTPVGKGMFQRVLSADLRLIDGECLVVTGYLDPDSNAIDCQGDAEVLII